MNGKAAKQFLENFKQGYGLMRGFMRDKAVGDAASAEVEELAPVSEIKVEDGAEPVKTDVAPKQYNFLGKTYNEPLTDQQISTARNRAVADAYKRWGDAAVGMQLENNLLTQERESAKFADWQKEAEEKDRTRNLIKQRDQIIADANRPAGVGTGFALDGQAGGTMVFNSQGNANTVLEGFGDVVKPEVKPAAWTDRLDGTKKLYTGLDAAVQAKAYNESNPITGYSRYRQIYDQLSAIPGMSEEADKYLAKIKSAKQEGAFDVLSRLERGDVDGAYSTFNQLGDRRWPEGSRIVKTGEKSGENLLGYNGAKYSLVGSDGRVLADDVVATLNRNILGPEKVAEMDVKSAEERKKRAERLEDKKELILFQDDVRGGSAGTATGSGGKGKAPPPPLEQTRQLIADALNQEPKTPGEGQFVTTPEQQLIANAAAESIHDLNPGIKPGTAAIAARAYAQKHDKPGELLFGWDAKTGTITEQVWTPQGLVAANRVTPFNAPARNLPPDTLKQAVETSINSLTGGDQSKRQAVILAATDATGRARRMLLDSLVESSLKKTPGFASLSPQMQAQTRKFQEQQVNGILETSLAWIKNYGGQAK